eukprot:CAMPEP_0194513940 /NCGR_PEP_ID=MMETSP0253-20130528/46250_1 /TAXON_ID=2966 /ORGANISM="Noctiluca scintillans" /LENGTH=286 /DNA_ID=CAMNT_0039357541 /DNA_START=2 /DNA_END=863 /DNA_ORIENTATION=+
MTPPLSQPVATDTAWLGHYVVLRGEEAPQREGKNATVADYAVVLFHGWLQDLEAWLPAARLIWKRHRADILLVDFHAHGKSPCLPRINDHTVRSSFTQAVHIVRHLGWEGRRLVIGGCSLGGGREEDSGSHVCVKRPTAAFPIELHPQHSQVRGDPADIAGAEVHQSRDGDLGDFRRAAPASSLRLEKGFAALEVVDAQVEPRVDVHPHPRSTLGRRSHVWSLNAEQPTLVSENLFFAALAALRIFHSIPRSIVEQFHEEEEHDRKKALSQSVERTPMQIEPLEVK